MIVFSEDAGFTLKKVESGYRGVEKPITGLNRFHSVNSFNSVKVNKNSKLLIRRVWVQFKGGPGLEPFGQPWIYPVHLVVTIMPYNIPLYINDWSKPIELNRLLPVQDETENFTIEILPTSIWYDGLNIQDIYDGATCLLSVWADIDGVLTDSATGE